MPNGQTNKVAVHQFKCEKCGAPITQTNLTPETRAILAELDTVDPSRIAKCESCGYRNILPEPTPSLVLPPKKVQPQPRTSRRRQTLEANSLASQALSRNYGYISGGSSFHYHHRRPFEQQLIILYVATAPMLLVLSVMFGMIAVPVGFPIQPIGHFNSAGQFQPNNNTLGNSTTAIATNPTLLMFLIVSAFMIIGITLITHKRAFM